MKKNNKAAEKYRVVKGPFKTDETYGNNGLFDIPYKSKRLRVFISDGGRWDHVSVSIIGDKYKTPTWEQMCFYKGSLF
jgi:hypothetical protein